MKHISQLGITKKELDTPALLLDLDLLEGNIDRMAGFFQGVEAGLRPHFKTHKTPIIAHKQLKAGAIGITCAKLDEAQALIDAGIGNILIANQVVTSSKIKRLAGLARHSDLIVAVENKSNARDLHRGARDAGTKISVIIETDVGMGRCGTRGPQESVDLASEILELSNLEFRGIMGYEGNCVMTEPKSRRREECQVSNGRLLESVHALREAGIEVEIVSAGGTGTYDITGRCAEITEIQAGSYATMDVRYHNIVSEFDCALTVLGTIISRPEKNRAIVDVGMKAVTKEFGLPAVKNCPDWEFLFLSEEHGCLRFPESADPGIGSVVEFIPSHGCTTINLHNEFFGFREENLEVVWEISARGGFR